MILYFSGTGNCEFTAKTIASKTNDKAVSITEIKDKIILADGENLGLVTPTFYWGLPSIVEEFLDKIQIVNANDSYIYYIATYGATSGQADYFVNEKLKAKGLKLSASYGIKTVDNWTVLFSVSDKKAIEETLIQEGRQISEILERINAKSREFISKGKKARWLCKMARRYYDKARKTARLRVSDDCINCGVCEKDCPTRSIKMVNGKPTWVTDKCAMCFKCLHSCPKFAIQYGNKTINHGQYKHPKFDK